MLGIISAAGNALRAFGSMHPAIKWGVVAIVGLLAVEFVGREAISLYGKLSLVRCGCLTTKPAPDNKLSFHG